MKLEESKEGRSSSGLVRLEEDMALFQKHSCLGCRHILNMRELKYLEALKAQVQLLKVRSTEAVGELRQKDL